MQNVLPITKCVFVGINVYHSVKADSKESATVNVLYLSWREYLKKYSDTGHSQL